MELTDFRDILENHQPAIYSKSEAGLIKLDWEGLALAVVTREVSHWGAGIINNEDYIASDQSCEYGCVFKPSDIQALADTINGKERDTELEQLRQQAAKAASLQHEVSHLRSQLSQAVQDNEFLQGWKDRHGQDLEQLHQQVAELKKENQQLRETKEQPKKSAMLLIALALELHLKSQRNSNQTRFVSYLLEGENSRLLSERTVNGLLAQAKKDLTNARKA